MPRVARVVVPGLPHHITHRGNRRSRVFFAPRDRRLYLEYLALYCSRYRLAIWAYCLMSNHVHLLAVPAHERSMADAVGRTHMMYSRATNSRHGWTGHLWANRYYSAPVDREGASVVARYIELNPVRAGMVLSAEEYRWSSAPAHCLGRPDPTLDPAREVARDTFSWRDWLQAGTDDPSIERIQNCTLTGTPLGSSEFVKQLEHDLGRRLTRRKYTRSKSAE